MLVTPRSEMPQGTISCEVVEIGGDVQGKAVRGDAARHVDAEGGDLFFPTAPPGMVHTPARPGARWVRTP